MKAALTARHIVLDLKKIANASKAKALSRYFKTGKGEYGEGDVFIGVTVPEMRKVAKRYLEISLVELKKLITSRIHEHRFVALEILVMQFGRAEKQRNIAECAKIFDWYLSNKKWINNWDLVDTSAQYIVGAYLHTHANHSKSALRRDQEKIFLTLLDSDSIWDRRIAVVATQYFIAKKNFKHTVYAAKKLLKDPHDLLHKAAGWMLREVGKHDRPTLEKFLDTHSKDMPRTMLRYAIEHFSPEHRKKYMKK